MIDINKYSEILENGGNEENILNELLEESYVEYFGSKSEYRQYKNFLHKKCGQHSGIPICCIDWYTDHWTTYFSDESKDFYRSSIKDCFNFIPCPNHLNQTKISINKCDCPEDRMQDIRSGIDRLYNEKAIEFNESVGKIFKMRMPTI